MDLARTLRVTSDYNRFYLSLCGEFTVNYAPHTLKFGKSGYNSLKTSQLDDVLAASLGYTPKSSSWKGLTISSPFGHPTAALVMAVHGGGARVAQEGATYGLDEDIALEDIYHDLKETVHGRSLRPTQFKHFSTYDSFGETSLNGLPDLVHLKADKEPDTTFLREMVTLPQITEELEKSNISAENEQDIVFLEIHSLAELVKEYGINSQQVAEAGNMLRSQLEKVSVRMRNLYGDSIIVMTTMIDQQEQPAPNTRSILQSSESGGDYNLAVEYSENYPAIFNIVLWGSIVLSLSILAISVSMATMDPGRDSIIYRMTNPRMKKDS
ncbi:unnamed protein product, partial [Meganyctiphanes norvegica]